MKKFILPVSMFVIVAIIVIPSSITFTIGVDNFIDYNDYKLTETEESVDVLDNDNDTIDFIPRLSAEDIIDKVTNPETKEIAPSKFEDYIKGVVGAEMPALFEIEALKAQAIAARTYAVNKIGTATADDTPNEILEGLGQAYLTEEELRQKWGDNFDEYYSKVVEAVESTSGEIMVYNNEPILAVFHSTSAGQTETAENIWNSSLPYLKTVDSRQDENAPNFIYETVLSVDTAVSKLQKTFPDISITQGSFIEQAQIIERTEAGYVKKIQVGNKILTGRQVRESLGLRSSNFTIIQEGNSLIITTKGYGHGAGMSQYGANFMAKEGSSYIDILNYYYKDIEIKNMNEIN